MTEGKMVCRMMISEARGDDEDKGVVTDHNAIAVEDEEDKEKRRWR